MLSKEKLVAMMDAEEKRLDVGSKEFMQRHNEIMQMVEEAKQEGGSKDGDSNNGDNKAGRTADGNVL